MPAINTLLAQLGWPSDAMQHRGTMTWAASTGDDLETLRTTSAAVLVGHDKLQARMRYSVGSEAGALEPHLDIQWQLRGEDAALSRFVLDGVEQPLDEKRAIEAFQDGVNRLGARPKFQQMAERKTPATPTRQMGV